ncbi:MAG: erythromycin esterase family protein [Bacteroidota bacterium]
MQKIKSYYLFFLLFFTSIGVFAQNDTTLVSKINLENNDDYSGFNILNSSVKGYKVFFTGENHLFQKSNVELELKMLKYLYKNAGVRYLFLEFGYSRGWLIDKYIQTGDSNLFQILDNYSFKTFSNFYKRLYEFNSKLDSSEKIHVIGIDCERFLGTPTKVLTLLLPKNNPPKEIELSVESLKGIAMFNDDYYKNKSEKADKHDFYKKNDYSNKNTLILILEDYNKNKSIYEKYIGPENFSVFNETMISIESYMKWTEYNDKNATHQYVYREQYMYNEFIKALKIYDKGNFFAQFGRCHVSTVNQQEACNWFDYNSIATRLNTSEDTIIKNKVFTIGVFYPKEEKLEGKDSINFNRIFSKANESGYTLIKINNDTIFNTIREKYKFLIINQNKSEKEMDENISDEDDENEDSEAESETLFHFNAFGGQQYFKLKNFNNFLNSYQIPSLNSTIQYYGFGITFCVKKAAVVDLNYNVFKTQTSTISGDSTSEFSGLNYFYGIGYDLINKNFAHFIPSIGFGYGQLKYVLKGNQNTLFGDNIISSYINPAFLLSLSLDARINIKFISIGCKASYIQDCSDQKWRSDNEIVKYSPKTQLSGFQIAGVVSILIK